MGAPRLVKSSKDLARHLRQGRARLGLELGPGGISFDAAGRRRRADSGHSIPVELEPTGAAPPDLLLHGTGTAALDHIRT